MTDDEAFATVQAALHAAEGAIEDPVCYLALLDRVAAHVQKRQQAYNARLWREKRHPNQCPRCHRPFMRVGDNPSDRALCALAPDGTCL